MIKIIPFDSGLKCDLRDMTFLSITNAPQAEPVKNTQHAKTENTSLKHDYIIVCRGVNGLNSQVTVGGGGGLIRRFKTQGVNTHTPKAASLTCWVKIDRSHARNGGPARGAVFSHPALLTAVEISMHTHICTVLIHLSP